jgi:hypothetical protein
MKKSFFLPILLFAVCLIASGCGKQPMMDELNAKGVYPYQNIALGFNLSLPQDFKYFQTQRVDTGEVKSVEIFVPTADRNFGQAFPMGYAKPVVVDVINKRYYENNMGDAEKQALTKLAEKGDQVYAIEFWDAIPNDWKSKWTDQMKKQIISGFSLR